MPPRIRTIKPEFFRSHDLYAAEFKANQGRQAANYMNVRVAFAGLFTVADRAGRFRWRPQVLKLDCLPYDAVDFNEVLAILSSGDNPFIVRYEVAGEPLGFIPGFIDHQRPNHREPESVLPEPPNDSIAQACPGLPGFAHVEGKGREGKGTGRTDSAAPPKAAPPASPSVMTFQCVGEPSSWDLTEAKLAEYTATFPGFDVKAECRKAWQWVQDNPTRRKTAGGMLKFLNTWLSKTQNSGRVGAGGYRQKPVGAAAPQPGKYAR